VLLVLVSSRDSSPPSTLKYFGKIVNIKRNRPNLQHFSEISAGHQTKLCGADVRLSVHSTPARCQRLPTEHS